MPTVPVEWEFDYGGVVFSGPPAQGPWVRTPLWLFWRPRWRRQMWVLKRSRPYMYRYKSQWAYANDADFLLM
jgi:hypothetical protein